MWTTSKNIYNFLKITFLFLAILLGYNFFITKHSTENKLSNNKPLEVESNNKDLIESVKVLYTFSKTNELEEIEKLPLSIGRNLFQNSIEQNVLLASNKPENTSPSIILNEISPNKVYQQNKPINILLKGLNFTNKTQVYVQTVLVKSNFISTTELEVILPIELVSKAGKILIEVKEKSTTSNDLYLEIEKFPTPDFVFVGTISDENSNKIILTTAKNQIVSSIGDIIKQRWKLSSLEGDFLIIEDLELNLKQRLQKGQRPKLDQPLIAETPKKSDDKIISKPETNLFIRPDKPMTSKELWEKRAAMRENKEKKK